jgi:hypothetical protein
MRSKEPYVVRQGDYLLQIAHRLGFDPEAVWQDDANSSLRQAREDPNMLCPTDILHVPTPAAPKPLDLVMGTTNTFNSQAPTIRLTIKFLDEDLASQPCSILELAQLTGLETKSDGSLTFEAPVTLRTATLQFTKLDVTCTCRIGWVDPIHTPSGIFQRLQNLGYIDADAVCDGDLELLRDALARLREDESSDGEQAESEADPSEGLNDDGTLESATHKRLRDAHGC